MEQEQIKAEDWRDEVSSEATETLKIADKETATFIFKDEGIKKTHPDFGTSIKFQVEQKNSDGEAEIKSWYVNDNNWDLKTQIKQLGALTGLTVSVHREGSKKSDTRYTISKVE